ncbi:MAG: Replication factor A [Methanomassiliicoccales archaeon PtaU1.Bin124]|nr:MAG: Replication factor A [Methanomassiliicoccales archaeon PtaU1.Bin124]
MLIFQIVLGVATGNDDHMANVKKVIDLKDREEVTVEVEVTKIFDAKSFSRKDGSSGKVRNLKVKDDSGECRIALWDNDVDMIENLSIVEGTKLRCQDCYVKQTDFGTDISKGKKGSITVI